MNDGDYYGVFCREETDPPHRVQPLNATDEEQAAEKARDAMLDDEKVAIVGKAVRRKPPGDEPGTP
jgi:1,2-phenylacetyl-CoA epoxidase PaaB subunit